MASAATIAVNSTADTIAVDGAVTLREALLSIDNGVDVNADITSVRSGGYGSGDTVQFAIGSGAKTIAATRVLPALLKNVVIDGTSQPGYAGTALITIDGAAAGAGSIGMPIHALTHSVLWGLVVQNFAGAGVRISTTVDRIQADGFDGQPVASPVGNGMVVLDDVAIAQNGGTGLAVDVGGVSVDALNVTVAANGGGGVLVTGASNLDLAGSVQINGNSGGTPVAFGLQVAPLAIVTLTGTQATPAQVNGNAGIGLLLRGNFSGSYVEVANNAIHGVWVDTNDSPQFPGGTPTRNSELIAFHVHGNGTSPGIYPPGGITVLRTRSTTASMPERFMLTQGDQLQTQSRIHDNLGDGVTLGGDPTPATGLCAILPPGLACGAVDGTVEYSHIFGNHQGIVVQEVDADQNGTVPSIISSIIARNADVGVHVHTSFVRFDQNGNYISGNLIGVNGWPIDSPDSCDTVLNAAPPGPSIEVASQVFFDGPAASDPAREAACTAHGDNVPDCNSDFSNTCIYNMDAPSNKCRPSYPLSAVSCSDTRTNQITGYHRAGPENEDLRVAIVAKDGAWVNAENAHFLTSAFEQHQDWSAIRNDSFAGNAGTVCAPAAQKCPAADPGF